MVIEGSDYSWTCPDQFTIGPNLKTQIDSLPTPSKFDVLTVRYKKWLNTQPAKAKFEATQITLNIDYKVKPPAYDERVDKSADIIGHTSYTLNWNEIKKILSSKNSPNFNAFINTVEKGELKFYDSNVAYGLIEDK